MKCPKCDKRALVIDTRYRKSLETMYRRYSCPGCGFRFSTNEKYAKCYTVPIAKIRRKNGNLGANKRAM